VRQTNQHCRHSLQHGGDVHAASAGAGTFTLPATEATTTGTHYLSFVYSGDAGSNGDGKGDFACSWLGNWQPHPILPDDESDSVRADCRQSDFTLTSTTGPISVVPGTVPSGNGLPSAPNQSSANPQSAILSIGGVLGFTGTVNLSNCVTQHPSYVSCFVGQLIVVNGATQPVPYATVVNGATVAVVFDVSTPATLPLVSIQRPNFAPLQPGPCWRSCRLASSPSACVAGAD